MSSKREGRFSVLFDPSEGCKRIFPRREEDAKLCVRNMESQDRRLAGFWANDPDVSRGFPGCRLFHGILAKKLAYIRPYRAAQGNKCKCGQRLCSELVFSWSRGLNSNQRPSGYDPKCWYDRTRLPYGGRTKVFCGASSKGARHNSRRACEVMWGIQSDLGRLSSAFGLMPMPLCERTICRLPTRGPFLILRP